MKLVSMTRAAEILGVTNTMRGDIFAKTYGLTPIETDMRHAKGVVRLFDESEVLDAKEKLEITPHMKRQVGNKWVPRESHTEQLTRVENMLKTLLSAFEIPIGGNLKDGKEGT